MDSAQQNGQRYGYGTTKRNLSLWEDQRSLVWLRELGVIKAMFIFVLDADVASE